MIVWDMMFDLEIDILQYVYTIYIYIYTYMTSFQLFHYKLYKSVSLYHFLSWVSLEFGTFSVGSVDLQNVPQPIHQRANVRNPPWPSTKICPTGWKLMEVIWSYPYWSIFYSMTQWQMYQLPQLTWVLLGVVQLVVSPQLQSMSKTPSQFCFCVTTGWFSSFPLFRWHKISPWRLLLRSAAGHLMSHQATCPNRWWCHGLNSQPSAALKFRCQVPGFL